MHRKLSSPATKLRDVARALFAESARTALEILERNSEVQLLFTDVMMPGGMNGIELARDAVARWPRLRVLLTSGSPEGAAMRVAIGAGPRKVLSKPYRKDELARALRRALEDESP